MRILGSKKDTSDNESKLQKISDDGIISPCNNLDDLSDYLITSPLCDSNLTNMKFIGIENDTIEYIKKYRNVNTISENIENMEIVNNSG